MQKIELPPKLLLKRNHKYTNYIDMQAEVGQALYLGDVIASCASNSHKLLAPADGVVSDYDDVYIYFTSNAKQISSSAYFYPLIEQDWHDTPMLLERINQAGVVGMGGAGFPTDIKLQQSVQMLIINAVECEPGMISDKYLLQHSSNKIITAIGLISRILHQPKIYLAIKENTHIPKTLKKLAETSEINLLTVVDNYPAGSEQNLIEMLKNKEKIKQADKQTDKKNKIICLNLATLEAVHNAISFGYLSSKRRITLHHYTFQKAQVVQVFIGTSIEFLLQQFNLNYNPDVDEIILGGLMMGHIVKHADKEAINAGSIGVFVRKKPIAITANPCIQCDKCSDICPIGLFPQNLYRLAQINQYQKMAETDLLLCIECGLCDFVCPSNIKLVKAFASSKDALHEVQIKQQKSDSSAIRHQKKLDRESQEKLTREKARRLAKKELQQQKIAPVNSEVATQTYQKQHIQALLEKTKKIGNDTATIAKLQLLLDEMDNPKPSTNKNQKIN